MLNGAKSLNIQAIKHKRSPPGSACIVGLSFLENLR